MNPCLTNLEILQEIFLEEKRPYWRLLSGRTISGAKLAENFDIEGMEDSCELLIRRIEQYGVGSFNVITFEKNSDPAKNNAKSNTNSRGMQHPIKIGGSEIGSTNSSQSMGFMGQFQQMMQFWEFMNKNSRISQEDAAANQEAAIEGAINDFQRELEIMSLKQELKEAQQPTTRDKVIEKLFDRLPLIAERMFPGAGIAGTIGYDEETEGQEASEQTETNANSGGRVSVDQMINTAMATEVQLQALGITYGVNEFYDRILQFAKNKPEQAKMILGQL